MGSFWQTNENYDRWISTPLNTLFNEAYEYNHLYEKGYLSPINILGGKDKDMKKLVILIAVFLMLAGGTVGTLKYMGLGPFKKDAPTPEQIAKAAEIAAAKKQLETKPLYVEMDPIQVPVFQDGGVAGTIMINYKIEALNTDNQQAIAQAKRRIGDALIKDFSYYVPRTMRNNKTLDVSLIKFRIIMISDKLLGKGVVNDALIQSMTSTQ